MANIKAAIKHIRRSEKQAAHNRSVRSRLRTLAKKALTPSEGADARSAAIEYISALDKAAKTGIIHLNKAHREKSKFSKVIFAAS